MMNTEKKRGRPSSYPPELGPGVKKNPRYPMPIHELLQEQVVKTLLSRMALDPEFKIQVLGLVGNASMDPTDDQATRKPQ